jgi:hypothetical protein
LAVLWAAILLFTPAAVRAQGALQQLGPLVPGHAIMGVQSGQVMDAGSSLPVPSNPGTRLQGLGVVNSGLGDCQWSTYPSVATPQYAQLCSGFDGSGNALITYDNLGGMPVGTLSLRLNGTLYPLPTVGGGNVVGPGTSTTKNLATYADPSGKLLANSTFAPTAIGRYGISQYGAAVGNSASVNATAIQNAVNAANTAGIAVICDVQGTLQTNTVQLYPFSEFVFAQGCQLQQQANIVFQTVDAVGHAYAQNSVFGVRIIAPNIDGNGHAGTPIMLDACVSCYVSNPLIINVGSGTWTYTDSFVSNGAYPSAGIIIKGSYNASAAIYNVVSGGRMYPLSNSTGTGIWLGRSAGSSGVNANFNTIQNIVLRNPTTFFGFDDGIKISAGGDTFILQVDVSGSGSALDFNSGGVMIGGDGFPVPRTFIQKLYGESVNAANTCVLNETIDSSSTFATFASTASSTNVVCDTSNSTMPFTFVTPQSIQANMNAASPSAPNPISNKDGFQVVPRDGFIGRGEIDGFGIGSEWTVYRKNGTAVTPTVIDSGDELGRFSLSGFNAAGRYVGAHVAASATENWSANVFSATVNGVGTGGVNGACTMTVSGGTGTAAQLSGTVSGGALVTGALGIVVAGNYTVIPGRTAVPVTGCSLTGATANLVFGTVTGGTKMSLYRTINGSATETVGIVSDILGGWTTCDSTGSCASTAGDGGFAVANAVTAGTTVTGAAGLKLPTAVNVSALPACNSPEKGVMLQVNDASAPTYNATVSGGGGVSIPVYCNGANWTAH